jgi:spermidine/putrescine transport system permease protein
MFFVPLVVVGIFSFNDIDSLNHFNGFSLDWYLGSPTRDGLAQDPVATLSIFYSFVIALLSSLIAVFFGLMAAFALVRYKFRSRGVLQSAMYLGLVIPGLILGVSVAILINFLNYYVLAPLSLGYGFSTPLQWEFGLASVVVGHATFNIPLATLVLMISFREFDRTLEEAAMNLGADEITTFFRVTIPNIMPGIISALLLGFAFSFDELPVTLFLTGGDVQTIPVFIWGLLAKKILSPRVNAASTIVLVISIIIVLITLRVARSGGKLFRI